MLKGTAEIFGTELAIGPEYTLSNYKGAIYTWHGCTLEYTNISKSTIGFQNGLNSIRAAVLAAKSTNKNMSIRNNNDFLPGGGLEGSTMEDNDDDDTSKDAKDGMAPQIDSDDKSSLVLPNNFNHSNDTSNNAANTENEKELTEISEYVSEESQMPFYANIHFALENIRNSLKSKCGSNKEDPMSGRAPLSNTSAKAPKIESTPRVLIIGPKDSGKTSLSKILVAYDVKRGATPVFVNLDPSESVFSTPGSLSASVISDILDVEQGWGSSPFTGPALFHPKQPHVRYFGLSDPMKNVDYYNQTVHHLAQTTEERLKNEENARLSGIYIDAPSSLVSLENQQIGFKIIQQIVKEFVVNVLLVVGNERLYSNMKKVFGKQSNSDNTNVSPVTVVNVPKSGGVVDRDVDYMAGVQMQLINEYFYGTFKQSLSPFTVTVDYSTFSSLYKVAEVDTKAKKNSGLGIGSEVASTEGTSISGDEKGDAKSRELLESASKSETLKDNDTIMSTDDVDTNTLKDSSTKDQPVTENSVVDQDETMFDIYDAKQEPNLATTENSLASNESSSVPTLIKIEPSPYLQNGVLAVLDANPDDPISRTTNDGSGAKSIDTANVLFYIHVVEVDDVKKKLRVLMPTHGRLPNKPFVIGDFRYYE